jgi:hypothetical protein
MTHFLSFVVKVLDGERQYSAPERVKLVNSDSHESVLCSCTYVVLPKRLSTWKIIVVEAVDSH